MSDIKLFRFSGDSAEELAGSLASAERRIHDLMEKHMERFLGIRFVAHEYSTGQNHRGRIDSLGLDENGCPVIIEYKRHSNENAINQGLYYLDWLLDHREAFKLLVLERFGQKIASSIEWNGTRVLCVAGDFTKYDEHAVAQMGRDIELIRYKYFGDNLLMLEWVNPVGNRKKPIAATTSLSEGEQPHQEAEDVVEGQSAKGKSGYLTPAEYQTNLPASIRLLFDDFMSYSGSLGEDVNVKELKHYLAFTRLKNFACLLLMKSQLKIYLTLNPATVTMEKGFSRNVSNIGHLGTGAVELSIRTATDLEKSKPLVARAYQEN